MEELIKALQIFLKYGNPDCPTHCEHDELFVTIDNIIVSEEDLEELERLGFRPCDDIFHSFKYGSA